MIEENQGWNFGEYGSAIEKKLHAWKQADFVSRIWQKDPAVWSQAPDAKELADRLGWLHLPQSIQDQTKEIRDFSEEVKSEDYRHVVLLGMGGSSLAPEVLQETFGNAQGYPELRVLDSTHPTAIRATARRIDPIKTLFLVSSKSGTTLETLTLFYYFWQMVHDQTNSPGRNFVAITDPGTPLAQTARERRFRRTFLAPPDVGGRYSALSVFGIVPAALIGIDIAQLLENARRMAGACESVDPLTNPGTILGAALGEMGLAGRDKLTFVTDAELTAFPLWLEQLIAESTGKNGRGLVPVAGERLGPPEVYGPDRLFVGLSLEHPETEQSEGLERLQAAGYPVLRIPMSELAGLGREFYRWEFAVAAAGAVLEINPFDQPDVQLAKDLARKAMESKGKEGESTAPALSLVRKTKISDAFRRLLNGCGPGNYIALQAYLSPEPPIMAGLESLRNLLRDRLHAATTVGVGPRFLHSTGQLHKGGPDSGIFLQFIDEPAEDLVVPEKGYTFGSLIRAQAEGDFQALISRNRRAIRINLGADPATALGELETII